MYIRDPSAESLPEDVRQDPSYLTFRPIGSTGQPPIMYLGPPFSEGFDRSVDSIVSPPLSPPGAGVAFTPPLWLSSPDTTHLTVAFGQVNGITPSGGWAGGGNDVGVSVDVSGYSDGTYNIYLNATLGADGVPTAVEVDASTSAVPANSTYQACNLIGQAVIASGVVTSVSPNLAWAQSFVTCGRDSADPATTPGTYFWELA